MSKRRQAGFSLLELLVAMMIIAVLGTLGFKQYSKHTAKARYLKAQDTLRIVAEGLDSYYLNPRNNGKYPDVTSFEAMVEANSVLVKQSLIPVNVATQDPWGQPYEGTSGRGTYVLKCAGDPGNQEDFPAFTREPGKIPGQDAVTQGQGAGQGAPKEGAGK